MSNSRLPGLDLVRVLSVLFIILSHAGYDTFRGIGVPFLLALSGFLITKTLLKSQLSGSGINITAFWKNRFLRIAPAYFVFVAAVFVLDTIILGDEWEHGLLFFLLTHTVNYYNSIFGHGEASGIVAHLWTLSTMEQFYLLYPIFLVVAFKSKNPVKIILLVIAFSIAWRSYIYTGNTDIKHVEAWLYNSLDTRMDSLLVGCLMAFALEKKSYNEISSNPVIWLAVIAVLFPTFTLIYKINFLHYTAGFTLEALLASAIILSLMKLSELKQLSCMNGYVITQLAKITYPMYLYHQIGLAVGDRLFESKFLVLCSGILFTIIIALSSYLIVEKRFIEAKRSNNIKGLFAGRN